MVLQHLTHNQCCAHELTYRGLCTSCGIDTDFVNVANIK